MSYSYNMPTPITISTNNLRAFGHLYETSRIDKLATVLREAGFDYIEINHIDDDGNYVSQFINVYSFGKIPEFGSNSGLEEIKMRFQKLVEITGGHIDDKHYIAIDEHHNVVVLNS